MQWNVNKSGIKTATCNSVLSLQLFVSGKVLKWFKFLRFHSICLVLSIQGHYYTISQWTKIRSLKPMNLTCAVTTGWQIQSKITKFHPVPNFQNSTGEKLSQLNFAKWKGYEPKPKHFNEQWTFKKYAIYWATEQERVWNNLTERNKLVGKVVLKCLLLGSPRITASAVQH